MVERRSLNTALELSPDQMAFIKGGAPEAEKLPSPVPSQATGYPPASDSPDNAEAAPLPTGRSARRTRHRRHARDPVMETEGLPLGIANLLVPLTTRLQPSTAVALKRAGLEQRLRGKSPATMQEIAEEAIQHWLHDYGYLG